MIRISNCFRLRTCTRSTRKSSRRSPGIKKCWQLTKKIHQQNPWRSTSTWLSSSTIYHHLPFTMSSPCHHHVSTMSSPCHHVILWGFPTEEGEAEHGRRRSDLCGSSCDSHGDRRTPCGVRAGCLVRAEEWPGALGKSLEHMGRIGGIH